jgi:hypothetical protein
MEYFITGVILGSIIGIFIVCCIELASRSDKGE